MFDFIVEFLFKEHSNELIGSLCRLKLLNETKSIDTISALSMWIDTNIGKSLALNNQFVS